MDERIREHLKYLNKYRLLLTDIKKRSYKDFMKDQILQKQEQK